MKENIWKLLPYAALSNMWKLDALYKVASRMGLFSLVESVSAANSNMRMIKMMKRLSKGVELL